MNTGARIGRDSTEGQAASISSKCSRLLKQRRTSILNARIPITLKSASSLQASSKCASGCTNERSAKSRRFPRLKADSSSSSALSGRRRVSRTSLVRTPAYSFCLSRISSYLECFRKALLPKSTTTAQLDCGGAYVVCRVQRTASKGPALDRHERIWLGLSSRHVRY